MYKAIKVVITQAKIIVIIIKFYGFLLHKRDPYENICRTFMSNAFHVKL